MIKQTVVETSSYEQALVSIVRTLPSERIAQILDYARYIQAQAQADFDVLDDDETEEAIRADEERWDAHFAVTQAGLAKMADKVRAEIRAGRTQKMRFTKDGKIAPG
ncbi:MAG: hypothetical protein U0350_43650 [Caldilineaceae bacterium]